MDGQLKARRDYVLDPYLSLSESLTLKDYKGASTCDGPKRIGYDKGHLAPVGSFKNTASAFQAQYLSNIVPQTRNLNQGPWRRLEEQVRKVVLKGRSARILTGPIFGKDGENKLPPCWKAAQGKIEEIPVSYWKIVAFQDRSQIKYCAFLFPQRIKNRSNHFKRYRTELNHIQQKTGLNFFAKMNPVKDCEFLL